MATEKMQVYRCDICGIVAEVLEGGAGELVCCGTPMVLLEPKTAETGMEKHVPVIERSDGGVKVKVGSVPHPMEEKHYIQWIELIADERVYRRFLKPSEAPEAVFEVRAQEVSARELCNVHGLWKGE